MIVPRARIAISIFEIAISMCLLAPSLASAGGFGRPNEIGARAVGMGGGYAAVADDPWALYHNPAGMAFPDESQVAIDLALLKLDREWTPPGKPTVTENTALQPIPAIAATTRFAFGNNKPARFAVGVGFFVTYGGKISFDPASVKDSLGPGASGITETGLTLFEVTPGVAYQVSDVLALGAALRVGISTFDVTDVEPAFSADNLSASGAGLGGSFSAMVRPHPRLAIGAVYRTTLSTNLTGSGNIAIGGGAAMRRDMSLAVTWPQSATLGLSVRVASFLRLVAQGDWTGWSSFQKLEVDFSGGNFGGTLSQVKQMQFSDTFTLHAGGEATFSRFAARLGFSVDGNAIPDATSRRENQDGLKYDATFGFGVRLSRFRIDAAFDYLFGGPPRMIAAGPFAEAGSYQATVLTFQLSASARF
jgi:long-chain fatty acid transport protein